MSKLLILMLLCIVSTCYELLQDIPITFKLDGNISYTPSSGGVNIQGYKLKLGFYKYSWIGVKLMSLTSRSNYDVIVVTRDSMLSLICCLIFFTYKSYITLVSLINFSLCLSFY